MDLTKMSAEALRQLADKANRLADDLEMQQPSYALALAAGIVDRSYPTVRNGTVRSFAGEAEIVMADGARWRAVGHGPRGTASEVYRQGYIEFIPI